MSVQEGARSGSPAWSNPVAWWWVLLTLVSVANIGGWLWLYRHLHGQPTGSLGGSAGLELMLLLCAAYVFGCAFRSFLPRADVQRICLFDTWLSSVVVGRSVATVAEICFAAQWVIVLYQLGAMTGTDTTVNAALLVMPLILIAEGFSWYAVITTKYWGNAIENSIWALAFFIVGVGLCRLLWEFDGPVQVVLVITIVGIAGYLAFLMTIDVPMYVKRWRAEIASRSKFLRPLDGLRDVSTRWVVTRDLAEWKDEILWMSLYFSLAVWASLALCALYSLGDHLPRYRAEAPQMGCSPDATAVVGKQTDSGNLQRSGTCGSTLRQRVGYAPNPGISTSSQNPLSVNSAPIAPTAPPKNASHGKLAMIDTEIRTIAIWRRASA